MIGKFKDGFANTKTCRPISGPLVFPVLSNAACKQILSVFEYYPFGSVGKIVELDQKPGITDLH